MRRHIVEVGKFVNEGWEMRGVAEGAWKEQTVKGIGGEKGRDA